MVDVVQEHVERAHALLEARVQLAPLRRRDHVRQDVEGNQPLGAALVAVDREGDAHAVEQDLGGLRASG